MTQPFSLDEVVDIVATHEPVTAEDVDEHINLNEIELQQVENLLTIAEERGRVLKVNGKFWVMRIGKYADDIQ
ncbi:hypothetical protein [Halorubrum ezzemoulense]|jgi:hypothetical protein|uniref:MarR family transcriptional regulator n=1 Tax=Halorubrum ezzemoulense TaxID=337243 RepID=A0A481RKZ3_HALEZ|nr:hypothetical protein [Halorubrum ezzemoulense]MDB2250101.1 hypothetical protein [Halorubrum ezzemoulense]QAY21957.1 hypothetical protein EO776_18560 [Halorubrum ezzemoulense]